MRRWSFAKGHGTENDFVILLDREDQLGLGPAEVQYLCDRRAGIGADGVLRAVSAGWVREWSGEPSLWFMDYRNADGSLAEMCGNGIRVFVRYLLDAGLVTEPTVPVATRAGVRMVRAGVDGTLSVEMGLVRLTGTHTLVTTADGGEFPAVGVEVGNPHAVTFVDDLAAVRLHRAPAWTPAEAYPDGVNVEFVQLRGPRHIAMRVYERGSGETRSCGTGTVAAAAATRDRLGEDRSAQLSYRVDVPGGTLSVGLGPVSDGAAAATLTGPAVLVAHGEVVLPPAPPHPHEES